MPAPSPRTYPSRALVRDPATNPTTPAASAHISTPTIIGRSWG